MEITYVSGLDLDIVIGMAALAKNRDVPLRMTVGEDGRVMVVDGWDGVWSHPLGTTSMFD